MDGRPGWPTGSCRATPLFPKTWSIRPLANFVPHFGNRITSTLQPQHFTHRTGKMGYEELQVGNATESEISRIPIQVVAAVATERTERSTVVIIANQPNEALGIFNGPAGAGSKYTQKRIQHSSLSGGSPNKNSSRPAFLMCSSSLFLNDSRSSGAARSTYILYKCPS